MLPNWCTPPPPATSAAIAIALRLRSPDAARAAPLLRVSRFPPSAHAPAIFWYSIFPLEMFATDLEGLPERKCRRTLSLKTASTDCEGWRSSAGSQERCGRSASARRPPCSPGPRRPRRFSLCRASSLKSTARGPPEIYCVRRSSPCGRCRFACAKFAANRGIPCPSFDGSVLRSNQAQRPQR